MIKKYIAKSMLLCRFCIPKAQIFRKYKTIFFKFTKKGYKNSAINIFKNYIIKHGYKT